MPTVENISDKLPLPRPINTKDKASIVVQTIDFLSELDIFLVLSNHVNVNVVNAAGNAVNNNSRLIKDGLTLPPKTEAP
jgi:hypothetical protein